MDRIEILAAIYETFYLVCVILLALQCFILMFCNPNCRVKMLGIGMYVSYFFLLTTLLVKSGLVSGKIEPTVTKCIIVTSTNAFLEYFSVWCFVFATLQKMKIYSTKSHKSTKNNSELFNGFGFILCLFTGFQFSKILVTLCNNPHVDASCKPYTLPLEESWEMSIFTVYVPALIIFAGLYICSNKLDSTMFSDILELICFLFFFEMITRLPILVIRSVYRGTPTEQDFMISCEVLYLMRHIYYPIAMFSITCSDWRNTFHLFFKMIAKCFNKAPLTTTKIKYFEDIKAITHAPIEHLKKMAQEA
ncbi:envelope protein [Murid herpesvirus 3]|uniref:Envelope protein n=2 Tax=Murid betaherpesvirus 3 TaxID=2560603 RepID=A0A1P8VIU6_9BETA|nr:envelope protein [Murine roseolovirus]APZ76280.1 envelope protein [Murid betaherpesvirus 3]AYH64765.1 envelope protein [Murid herpesvirus 3]